jgi:hypothetical protein
MTGAPAFISGVFPANIGSLLRVFISCLKNGNHPAEQILERTAQYFAYKYLDEAEKKIENNLNKCLIWGNKKKIGY